MSETADKKVYFASDFHFGIPDLTSSRMREALFVEWLDMVKQDAAAIYLMGDLFDFWFEYHTVVPKGYIRLLGKLAEISDAGIPIHLFRGNHDVWAFHYLSDEVDIILHREPEKVEIFGTLFYLAHGDGLGPGDTGYKFLKKVFECGLCQYLFRWLHPDLGTRLGLYFSRKSRLANMAREGKKESGFVAEKEMLITYAQHINNMDPGIQYFVFGHRHIPLVYKLDQNTQAVLLGDWLVNFSYLSFDGKSIELKYFGKDASLRQTYE